MPPLPAASSRSSHHAQRDTTRTERRAAARRVSARDASTTTRASKRTYRVQPGDSFWSIAKSQHVGWFNLAADNHLHMYDVLHAGQVLTLPRQGEAPHAPLPLAPPEAVSSAAGTSSSGSSASSAYGASASETTSAPATSYQTSTTAPAATTTPAATSSTPTASSSQASAPSGSSSFEQCVISRESGGNAQATNGSGHYGLFQFSQSTWNSYGGNPSDFGSASTSEQQQVFNNAVAQGGQSNWAPYDGC